MGEVGRNGKLDKFVAVIVIITVVRMPHCVPLLTSFVGLQQAEGILIKSIDIVCNIPLLKMEEIKYILWLQQLIQE